MQRHYPSTNLTALERRNVCGSDFEFILLTAFAKFSDFSEMVLYTDELSPEQIAIKNCDFNKLTLDSKEVIYFIIHKTEVFFTDGYRAKKYNERKLKTRVRRFFMRRWGYTGREVDRVFTELKEYVKSF